MLKKLTMMFYYMVMFFTLGLLFLYPNSLMMVFMLLSLVLILMYFLFLHNLISSLICLMVVIIYLGAMMILISYICAICPNMKINSIKSYMNLILMVIILSYLSMSIEWMNLMSNFNHSLYLFFTIIAYKILLMLMLFMFLILLSVTSQFILPQGPFRSI